MGRALSVAAAETGTAWASHAVHSAGVTPSHICSAVLTHHTTQCHTLSHTNTLCHTMSHAHHRRSLTERPAQLLPVVHELLERLDAHLKAEEFYSGAATVCVTSA